MHDKVGAFRTLALAGAALSTFQVIGPAPAQAQDYDMDCKVILCLAGGFPPPECNDAYAYMVDRITRFWNPLPPFGACTMSGGTDYANYEAPYSQPGAGSEESYDCPSTHTLYISEGGLDEEADTRPPVCHTGMIVETYMDFDGDYREEILFEDSIRPNRIDFKLQLTVEPGTDSEYVSPLFLINTQTGYFRADTGEDELEIEDADETVDEFEPPAEP